MESTSSRLIMPGTQYDYLFPKPNNRDETIKRSADVSDTVSFIKELIPKTLADTRKLVEELLWDKDLKKFCSKAWHFAYHHIPYKRDEDGIEQVRRPARAWADRHKGGIDCDCYTVFLGSCLRNAGIKFHLRITKYPKEKGETPYWQHIYIVVPKNQKAGYSMDSKEDYWVLDCVKDRFNSEEPFLEFKDYPMRLDYLNGLDSDNQYKVPQSVDAQDLAATNDIDELGDLGEWLQAEGLGRTKAEKKERRKQFFKKGLRFFNRALNPATIALRNSVLLAMKVNFLKVASKIRYGYLSDAQAMALGLNMGKFNHLKKVKEKVEKIYEKAGGKKDNFKKAVLRGHGNKDRKVPLNGLEGTDELYGDFQDDENRILGADGFEGLEEIYGLGDLGFAATATLAAATTVLTPIVAALSKLKGLFPKKNGAQGAQGAEFDSDPDPNEAASGKAGNFVQNLNTVVNTGASIKNNMQSLLPAKMNFPTRQVSSPSVQRQEEPQGSDEGEAEQGEDNQSLSAAIGKKRTTVPATNNPTTTDTSTTSSDTSSNPAPDGAFGKALDYAKKNPVVTALVAGAVGFGIYKLVTRKKLCVNGLGGLPSKRRRKGKPRKAKNGKSSSKRARKTHKKIFAVKLR